MRRAVLLVSSICLVGCAPESSGVLLLIDLEAPIEVPGHVDEIRVEATASRRETADLCEALQWSTLLDSRDDLPLRLLFHPGETYGQWMAVRVHALKDGEPTLRFGSVRVWPDEGTRELSVTLEAACLDRLCDERPDEQCVHGVCQNAPLPEALAAAEGAEPCAPE